MPDPQVAECLLEGKRQAPLREGQALSRPLRALPRPAAGPPRPARWGLGVPIHGVHGYAVQAGMSYRPRDEGVYLCLRLAFSFLLLDEKEPKNQGQNHRPDARPPKRLTFKSGSAFGECKRKRPSLKVKRLVVPWATAAPRFGRAHAPNPVGCRRSRARHYRFPFGEWRST